MNNKNIEFKEYTRCSSDKSSVWSHFLRSTDAQHAQCKLCKKKYKTSNTTSVLHNHLKHVHAIQLEKRNSKPLAHNYSSDSFTSQLEIATTSSSTTTITSADCDEPKEKRAKNINDFFFVQKEDLGTMIAKMTALDGLPFRVFCSSDTLRKLFLKAGHKDLPTSPNTIKNIVLKKSQQLKKEVVYEIDSLKAKNQKFTLSLDEWTSARNRRYINVNIHSPELSKGFINLGLSRIRGRGTADNCFNLLKEKLSQYSLTLDNDIACIVTDGASVMCALGRMVPAYHQLCLAHGIQCAVLDVLYKNHSCDKSPPTSRNNCNDSDTDASDDIVCDDSDDDETEHEDYGGFVIDQTHQARVPKIVYKDVITKVRQSVKYFKSSPTRTDLLNTYLTPENKGLSLILDCKTRWSSLADMLSRFLQLRDPVQKTLIDLKNNTKFTDTEIKLLEDLAYSLSIVKATVEVLCEHKANLLTAEAALKFMVEKLAEKNDTISSQLVETLTTRITQRRNTDVVSTLKYLHHPSKYYEENNSSLSAFPNARNANITDTLVNINKKYFSQENNRVIEDDAEHEDLTLLELQTRRIENENNLAAKSLKEQLQEKIKETILGTAVLSRNVSINNDLETTIRVQMALYDRGGPRNVHLKQAYQFLLTIPPTSVEPERVFSANRFFCNHLRSSFNDKTLDALSFLRSYFLNNK